MSLTCWIRVRAGCNQPDLACMPACRLMVAAACNLCGCLFEGLRVTD